MNQKLEEFAITLETPPAVLKPTLTTKFIDLWHERQVAEPLLRKLPKHIQQRSVLLRFSDELLELIK